MGLWKINSPKNQEDLGDDEDSDDEFDGDYEDLTVDGIKRYKFYDNQGKPVNDKRELIGEAVYNSNEIRRGAKKSFGKKGSIQIETGELRVLKTFPKRIKLKDEKILKITFRGKNFAKEDLFGLSDPYFILKRYGIFDDKLEQIYQSEILMTTLNPKWNEFVVPKEILGVGRRARKLLVVSYDWNRTSKDDLIGEVEIEPNGLKAGKTFILTLPGKKKNRGELIVESVKQGVHKVRSSKPAPRENGIVNLLTQSGYYKIMEKDINDRQITEVWNKIVDGKAPIQNLASTGGSQFNMSSLKGKI